ncbi:hypothetical protein BHM03_00019315 [Ensete ventricosum]|uniref:CTLH domain-containing protein n=1 Tax=Ensete ventricosum TaxID=4639 RepID=A0A426ZYA6_ENSVE|nr:hypothetical protein B296_00033589 [Ensete ventricosum]RZR73025.1 hypothetical protein BHM03_00019315 [Ensete ventricosum]
MKHFEDLVQGGEWDEVERYLGGFTKVEDNRYSMKIFFEIRKQKYLEALDRWDFGFSFKLISHFFNCFFVSVIRHDRAKAVEILVKDLKVFASFNEELFKEITQLLTLENFREVASFIWKHDRNSVHDSHQISLLHLATVVAAMDNNRVVDIKPKISEDAEKMKSWKLADIVDSAHLRTLRLPDTVTNSTKVCL